MHNFSLNTIITNDKNNSNSYKSVGWILIAYFLYTMTMSLAKLLDKDLSVPTIIFMRCLFGYILFIPLILDKGFGYYQTSRLKLHLLRVVFGTLSMFFTYYTYITIPLSLATSIGFTSPILVASLSAIILKDKVSNAQWLAIIIGYFCVLIIIQPITFVLSHGIFTAILANTFAGLAIIVTKLLTATEDKKTILLYSNTAILMIMGILSFFTWTTPSTKSMILLVCMGATAMTYQYCFVQAMSLGKPSVLAPFEYARLLFAIPIGIWLFNETISIWMIIGSIILVTCNSYIMLNTNSTTKTI